MSRDNKTFHVGDVVRIRDAFLNSQSEKEILFVVVNANEATRRCYIQPLESILPIPPQELVSMDMIQTVE